MDLLSTLIGNDALRAVLALAAIALAFGAILGFAAVRFRVESDPVVEQIDALLPQTQCGQCGHPGCRPYAEAIADGEAINRCPPGGDATIAALADLLGRDAEPLDGEAAAKTVAYIREEDCIGCTKCIQACPVDAIVGASRYTHTVIAAECTGCDLCVEPCPVDCIDMLTVDEGLRAWHWQLPEIGPRSDRANLIVSDRAEPRRVA